ncbi:MAG: hypothetical protein DRH90_24440 [Deltaproteobacteria bacterium]|nr:MAG: hypothetical protein DRH90_24440 [Deltaproteobacteria bacterium]
MPQKYQNRVEWPTRQGKIIMRSFCGPDEIASLSFILLSSSFFALQDHFFGHVVEIFHKRPQAVSMGGGIID